MMRRKSQQESNQSISRLRTAAFCAATLVIFVVLLAIVELVLRLCIPAPEVSLYDPYVSFSGQSPLFVLEPTGARYEIAQERLSAFRPQSFSSAKGGAFRAFCLGGSTVQGRPYSVETSFTTWLELNLRAAQPDVDYEIVNCGGISYASYRLVPIVREVLEHEPDLLIICTGHNEFLEDRTYEHIKKVSRVLVRLHRTLLNLRSYSLVEHALLRHRTGRPSKTILANEVQAKLDTEQSLGSYRRDEQWRRGTIKHFRLNLETMVRMAQSKDVPVILMNPVSNLKDCPPFKSVPKAGLSESQEQQVDQLRARARELNWDNAYEKIKFLKNAVAIDDRDAGLLFMLGACYAHIGRSGEAEKWFIRAKEEDVCPLRILEPMRQAIEGIVLQYEVPYVDVTALIREHTEDGIPGDEWLLDHVHPTISGHQLIADSLYKTIEERGLVNTPDDWESERSRLWQQHMSSLSDVYHAQGVTRLKWLQEWSRGRIPEE
jgi:lysophospholipase L1-like esterase